MIAQGAVLSLKFLFGKLWYTNVFTNSYIQVFHPFTKIGLTEESTQKLVNGTQSKIFGNEFFEMKVDTYSGLICKYYMQFTTIKHIFNDFLQLSSIL